jgi:peptidyl-tRNA hydrolase, PTH1 family
MPVRVIAGLGNPGATYDGTRHNVGFLLVDTLAQKAGVRWKIESKFCAHTATVELCGRSVLLCKPQTYMNESGRSIGQLLRFYKWAVEDLVVVYDEYQIPLAECKLSLRGSAGGHNGIASILAHCGDGFSRYRIGIGPTEKPPMALTDFVLGKFTETEREILSNRLPGLLDGVHHIIQAGPLQAMNHLNQRRQTNESQPEK